MTAQAGAEHAPESEENGEGAPGCSFVCGREFLYPLSAEKGGVDIRYLYRPRHPWRHGYRREKRMRRILLAAKLFLLLGSLWFSKKYLDAHTRTEIVRTEAEELPGIPDRSYGIGIDEENGTFFLFRIFP